MTINIEAEKVYIGGVGALGGKSAWKPIGYLAESPSFINVLGSPVTYAPKSTTYYSDQFYGASVDYLQYVTPKPAVVEKPKQTSFTDAEVTHYLALAVAEKGFGYIYPDTERRFNGNCAYV